MTARLGDGGVEQKGLLDKDNSSAIAGGEGHKGLNGNGEKKTKKKGGGARARERRNRVRGRE